LTPEEQALLSEIIETRPESLEIEEPKAGRDRERTGS